MSPPVKMGSWSNPPVEKDENVLHASHWPAVATDLWNEASTTEEVNFKIYFIWINLKWNWTNRTWLAPTALYSTDV